MKKKLGEAPLYLGGWLIFIGLRLILGIASYGNSLLSAFHLELTPAGQIFRLLSILFLLHQFVALYLLLKRHKAFPAVYIILESLFIIMSLYAAFMWFGYNRQAGTPDILNATLPISISTLCIVYMLLSKRVRKTLVFKRNETPDQRLIDKVNNSLSHEPN